MKNQEKGFSPEPSTSISKRPMTEREKETLRSEFKIMQKLDFVFIKELGAHNAEEYIVKITELHYSPSRHCTMKKHAS